MLNQFKTKYNIVFGFCSICMKFFTPDLEQRYARLIFSTKFMFAWKKLNF